MATLTRSERKLQNDQWQAKVEVARERVNATGLCDCGHPPTQDHSSISTGYGYDNEGRTLCFECCGEQDRVQMQETGRTVLYLTCEEKMVRYGKGTLTNWPGTLKYSCQVQKGSHNMAGTRYDVWFRDEKGSQWHGVQYGEFTQLCHCKRLKGK